MNKKQPLIALTLIAALMIKEPSKNSSLEADLGTVPRTAGDDHASGTTSPKNLAAASKEYAS